MEEKVFSFEKLEVYKSARILVRDIYRIQSGFPKYEIYALGDQVRRSSSSVTSNIAEGSGRNSFKEKSRFIEMAYGSLMEAFSQLQIAQDLGYVSEEQIDTIRPQFIHVAKMLSGLKSYFDNTPEKTVDREFPSVPPFQQSDLTSRTHNSSITHNL